MTDFKCFAEYIPTGSQVKPEKWRMPAIDLIGQDQAGEMPLIKKMPMFGTQLNGIPKENIVSAEKNGSYRQ